MEDTRVEIGDLRVDARLSRHSFIITDLKSPRNLGCIAMFIRSQSAESTERWKVIFMTFAAGLASRCQCENGFRKRVSESSDRIICVFMSKLRT